MLTPENGRVKQCGRQGCSNGLWRTHRMQSSVARIARYPGRVSGKRSWRNLLWLRHPDSKLSRPPDYYLPILTTNNYSPARQCHVPVFAHTSRRLCFSTTESARCWRFCNSGFAPHVSLLLFVASTSVDVSSMITRACNDRHISKSSTSVAVSLQNPPCRGIVRSWGQVC